MDAAYVIPLSYLIYSGSYFLVAVGTAILFSPLVEYFLVEKYSAINTVSPGVI